MSVGIWSFEWSKLRARLVVWVCLFLERMQLFDAVMRLFDLVDVHVESHGRINRGFAFELVVLQSLDE